MDTLTSGKWQVTLVVLGGHPPVDRVYAAASLCTCAVRALTLFGLG